MGDFFHSRHYHDDLSVFLYLTAGWLISIVVIYIFMIASRHENKTGDEKYEP